MKLIIMHKIIESGSWRRTPKEPDEMGFSLERDILKIYSKVKEATPKLSSLLKFHL